MNLSDPFNDPIPFSCLPDYDDSIEILKYAVQASYLLAGGVLHIAILRVILIKHRKFYKENSFFNLFAADCIASLYMILTDIFILRLLLYIPPICRHYHTYFFTPSIILKFTYLTTNYARAAKSVIQIFLVLNRMTCVLFPVRHVQIWKNCFKIALSFIVLIPICVIWNIAISRVTVRETAGGMGVGYIKTVHWASLSTFHLILVTIALAFTIICTSITLYGLLMLPHRVKAYEKLLCIASIIISIAFSAVGAFQFIFAFCSSCPETFMLLQYQLQYLAFDFLNIGSPIVMVFVSSQLWQHINPLSKAKLSIRKKSQVSHSFSLGDRK